MVAGTHIERRRELPAAFSALKYPNFRLLIVGQIISMSGTWMQIVAQGWLVFSLTKSELWLGIVSCASGLPSLLLWSVAGAAVERYQRHKLVIITQTAQMILAFVLAGLTFAGVVQVWHVVALAFFLGMTNTLDIPARQSLTVDLVGKEDMQSGISLASTVYNGSRVLGPSAAGLALVALGPAWCFFINGVSFLAVLVCLLLMRVERRPSRVVSLQPLLQLRESVSFSRNHTVIGPLLLLAAVGAVFSFNVITLMPAFADRVLNSPDQAYAILSAANGLGAVLATVLVAYFARRYGRGHVLIVMATLAPIFTVIFGLTNTIPTAFVLTLLAGFTLILQFVVTNTLIQSAVPDEFRGRVMSMYALTFSGLAPFAAVALGAFAEAAGVANAVILCGVCALVLNGVILMRAGQVRAAA